MGKYTMQVQTKERPWEIHPIWRGIGCLMILIIPFMAYAGGEMLIKANLANRWLPYPPDLAKTVVIPVVEKAVPHLYATLMVMGVLALIGYGILVVLYALVYRVAGPPRYGPTDSPPLERSRRR